MSGSSKAIVLGAVLIGGYFLARQMSANNNSQPIPPGSQPFPPGSFVPGYGYTETQLWLTTSGYLINQLGQTVATILNTLNQSNSGGSNLFDGVDLTGVDVNDYGW